MGCVPATVRLHTCHDKPVVQSWKGNTSRANKARGCSPMNGLEAGYLWKGHRCLTGV